MSNDFNLKVVGFHKADDKRAALSTFAGRLKISERQALDMLKSKAIIKKSISEEDCIRLKLYFEGMGIASSISKVEAAPPVEVAVTIVQPETPAKSVSSETRKGLTNAKFNEENSKILNAEIVLISIITGVSLSSWLVGGATLLLLIFAALHKHLSVFLMLFLSIGWGYIGYEIGSLLDSGGAMFVLSIIGFLSGLGVHLSAIQWVDDIGS